MSKDEVEMSIIDLKKVNGNPMTAVYFLGGMLFCFGIGLMVTTTGVESIVIGLLTMVLNVVGLFIAKGM